MVFAKAFLLSLAAYVGINFLFLIISSLISDTLDILFSVLETAPLMILYYLFGPITTLPSRSLILIVNFDPFVLSILIRGIGLLIAPLIAAILSGSFGESKAEAFGGWLLTAAISAGMIILAVFLSGTVEGILSLFYSTSSQMTILIYVLISFFINFIGFGFFALLVCKTEYY